jgi:hypothetical protein
MEDILQKSGYSFTIEPVNDADKKIVLSGTRSFVKIAGIVFSVCVIPVMIVPFFTGNFKAEDAGLIVFIPLSILLFLYAVLLILFLQVKTGLKNRNKIVEKGLITKQEKEYDDSGETIYSFIGAVSYPSLPANIKVGDKISIEHTISIKNRKNLFIKVEKI